MFCGGHAHLGDSAGRILFAGGGGFCGHGFAQVEYKTSLYVPQMGGIGSFIAGPDEIWCRDPLDCPGTLGPTPRWYPTLTLRGNGHVLVFDGRCDDQCGPDCNATCINDLGRPSVPLLINAGAGDPSTWGDSVPLYDAGYNAPPAYPGNPCPDMLSPAGNDFNMGWYTNVYQLADGTMGMTGGRYEAWPNLDTRKLDTEQEEWTLVAESPVPTTAFGCSVMYRGNQVLRAGGGLNNPGHDVFVMDFAAQNPVWTARSPRPRDKDHFYLNDYRSLRHLPTGARFRSVVCPCMS